MRSILHNIRTYSVTLVTIFLFFTISSQNIFAQRVKDLVEVEGARSNFIEADGLVYGLKGTGDSSKGVTMQKLRSYLSNQNNWKVSEADIVSKNVALVHIEAELPPFQAEGTKIDLKVSALGDAKSLSGGRLLITPLRSPRAREDQNVYALAQGDLIVDGDNPTVGYVPNGAIVEKALVHNFIKERGNKYILTLHLNRTDFSLANTIADAINNSGKFDLTPEQAVELGIAYAVDGGTIEVRIPTTTDFQLYGYREFTDFVGQPVKFISRVLDTNVQLVGEDKALVIINDKTKVISVTGDVMVKKGRAQKGSISLEIKDDTLLQDIMKEKEGITSQDMIDLVKALSQAGLIKGKVISN